MKNFQKLDIEGAILDEEQLKKHLEKMAMQHTLKSKANKNTYPVPQLVENYIKIKNVYKLLNEHIKLGINIHPAGEWILDNFYIIEEAVRQIEKEMTLKKYANFVGIQNGKYAGFARIYVLATEIVAYTDNKINGENLKKYLQAYQTKKTLNMEEIWNIGIFLQIAIINNIAEISEKIYSSQIQKYKVKSIIERLVENKEKNELKYNQITATKLKNNESVTIDTICNICDYFRCMPDEIMEFIPEENYPENIKAKQQAKQQIQAQIAELQAKLKEI